MNEALSFLTHSALFLIAAGVIYALSIVADKLSTSQQPLVPSQLFMASDGGGGSNMLSTLLSIITAEKLGVVVNPKKVVEAKAAEVN